ncbi:MAG: HAD-IC family P-type ATPase [Trueperaceae bacterium]|nr:HAD-IC family P-type ATPase [Trueperaceae bacterium]
MTTDRNQTQTDRRADGEGTVPPRHAWSVERVARDLDADLQHGLSEGAAAARLARVGPNRLPSPGGKPVWKIALEQFTSLIVLFLVAAAAIALVAGDTVEAVAIGVVIAINAVVGFATELRAAQAIASLQRQAAPTARVLRGGVERTSAVEDLVPGDVVLLAEGDRVPADGRLIESARLQLQEAALTGESQAVEKLADADVDERAPLAERLTMAFLGTTVTAGRGRLLVTGTGRATEVGRIGVLLEETELHATPLERRLEKLGRVLIGVVLAVAAVVVAAGVLRGNDLIDMLEVGIALAIAAVPEGLPAVATMTLALGVQRMARANALVRRLPAVETLGSTTVICTDKTGTLTRNEMTVRCFVVADRRIDVTGVGYDPSGRFERGGEPVDPADDELLRSALMIGVLCNDARLADDADRAVDADGGHGDGDAVLGDPTEGALLVAAVKAGIDLEALRDAQPRVDEVPFDAAERRMVTAHRHDDGGVVYVKGAPAVVLERCDRVATDTGSEPLDDAARARWRGVAEDLADEALRVLALAVREVPDDDAPNARDDGLTFVGLVGMIDPLRDEAARAVARCRAAGIRTVMITGDHPRTASVIAHGLGIDRGLDGAELRTWYGPDLEGRDEAGWREAVADAAVFARVSPEHKLRIVEALQARGEVVAMTGDGVNDAPALRTADIGIAMGIKGTEVAKEAAAMVLRDDDFGTIVRAVEQGRVIYANIQRFVHYLFSCNLAEILTVFLAIMLGWPLPLAALQILWLNMITDVFPALALALEPSDPDVMRRPPRDPAEPLLSRAYVVLIVWQGLLLGGVTLAAFAVGLGWYGRGDGLPHAVTIAFSTLALTQVAHTFNARSVRESVVSRRTFANGWVWGAVLLCLALQLLAVYQPGLQRVLGTVALDPRDWALVASLALLPVVVTEVVKAFGRRRG